MEYIISKLPDKKYGITTNGYYLEEFIDLFSRVTIHRLTVTLDGDEATHNSKRMLANGNPTYQKILSGIKMYLESGVSVTIRMNVDNGYEDEFNRQRELLINRFDEHKERLFFEISPMMGLSSADKAKMVDDMFSVDVEYSHRERIHRNLLLASMNPLLSAFIAGIHIRPLYSFCYAHENRLAFDPYGNMFTCLVTVGKDDMATGKYYPEIVFNENSIRNRNIDMIPECRECVYSLLCGGGCPMRLEGEPSDIFRPACDSIKDLIHILLPRFYQAEKDFKVRAGETIR